MAQQIMIIGLGKFGMALAQELSEKGAEVMAVDNRSALVEKASAFVAEAVTMDATDEESLARLEPAKRDAVICAIGGDSRDASILCTALLRQMGAKWIVARANDEMRKRILKMVGAHQVVDPQQEFGKRYAMRLLFRNMVADASYGEDLHLMELCMPAFMVGKTLAELALPRRFGVIVVGIRQASDKKIQQPGAQDILHAEDNLIVAAPEVSIMKMMGKV